MSRAETSSDVFNALATPRRREVLSLLADTEKHLGDIAAALLCIKAHAEAKDAEAKG